MPGPEARPSGDDHLPRHFKNVKWLSVEWILEREGQSAVAKVETGSQNQRLYKKYGLYEKKNYILDKKNALPRAVVCTSNPRITSYVLYK